MTLHSRECGFLAQTRERPDVCPMWSHAFETLPP